MKILKRKLNQLKKPKISKLLFYLLLTLSLILIFVCIYIKESFYNVTVEQLIYSFKTATGTSDSMIIGGVTYVFPTKSYFCIYYYYNIIIIMETIYKN